MPYYTFKRSGKNRYLVLRWKKRIDGIPTVVKEVSVGTAANLAEILENGINDIVLKSYTAGSTLSVLYMDKKIGLRDTVNRIIGHKGNGMSPGDYMLLFVMNRLSDPCSKNSMEKWMNRDYASIIFPKASSQDFWNVMDRFSDKDMKDIQDSIRDKVMGMGYDFSNIFFDASNMYTFMEENDMAKKGHNKKHRYDLNQVSYYIASSYDYIPLYFESYAGNIHDSKTFESIIGNIPVNSTLIFDRGYNSKNNIDLISDRKYIGALKQSDHHDIMELDVGKDSYIELLRNVYGKDHRIILYHSQSLEKRKKLQFMKRIEKVMSRVKRIIDTGDSDSMEKARIYLESENLNETILLPSLEINQERMYQRLSMMGKNAVFTDIMDMDAEDIIGLYKKRNRVEHCFRTINTVDMAFPLYHWTPQKIRVHMFFSLMAYLFLALIYNEIHSHNESVSLISTVGYLKDINLNYAIRGKSVTSKIECKSEISDLIGKTMNMESMIKD
ncbi:MAG: transposase [Candidatus Thermoplasmatota archaeon]|nr:transposase [Candidatus Thermoplasmatota archaeon]